MYLIFVDAGVKINELLLTQKLLAVMREISDEFFIFDFQQRNRLLLIARPRETINLLGCDVRHLHSFHQTFGPDSTDPDPTEYKIRRKCSRDSARFTMSMN